MILYNYALSQHISIGIIESFFEIHYLLLFGTRLFKACRDLLSQHLGSLFVLTNRVADYYPMVARRLLL